ncbi:MAG TPA: endolytic transglycosylase MltG [Terriglobales bacterium]|nr:endolytic transglycosylase MltG [Terriglobales bacterium]
MTLRGGRKPRSGGMLGPSSGQAQRRIVDAGWDDYIPPDAQEIEVGRRPTARDTQRNYRQRRSGGMGHFLRFALFAAIVGSVVVGGLYFVARPIVVSGIVGWAAENPTALKLPFISDIVRGELGPSLTAVEADDATAIVIVISAGETPHQIGDQLVGANVIADARAFVFEAIQKDVTESFQIGRHVVTRAMTVDQIIAVLITPPVAPPTVRVIFREGLRIEQMVAKLEYLEANPGADNNDPTAPLQMKASQFYELATNPPAALLTSYPWLKLPQGASLEGYLFPATYEIAPDTTPLELMTLLLDAFASHAPPGLLDLPPDQIYQTVQLASLVESEAKVDSDRALVAGVYANRLDPKKWPTGLLDADPTLNYANDSVWLDDPANSIDTWLGYTFWVSIKTTVAYGKVVFPGRLAGYNTYSHAGLPPTPICSPGAASLAAALKPDMTDGYMYFLAKNDGSGTHAFAKTQAEQNANAKTYGYVTP